MIDLQFRIQQSLNLLIIRAANKDSSVFLFYMEVYGEQPNIFTLLHDSPIQLVEIWIVAIWVGL